MAYNRMFSEGLERPGKGYLVIAEFELCKQL